MQSKCIELGIKFSDLNKIIDLFLPKFEFESINHNISDKHAECSLNLDLLVLSFHDGHLLPKLPLKTCQEV